MKRALTPSDEDGEEKKGESEGSAMEEGPTPCSPQGGKVSKQEKLRVKRRRRKERMKAARSEPRWEEDISDLPLFDISYDAYLRMCSGR